MTKVRGLLWLAWLATLWIGDPAVLAADRDHVLILGKVSATPHKHYRMLTPIVEYVADHLRDLGIEGGHVRLARNHMELALMLRNGEVDWVTDSVFPALFLLQNANAEILLKRWKQGVSEYHTVFITHKDSPIQSLDDLMGKTLAFEDPGSTTAFFIPVIHLFDRGYSLKRLTSPRDEPEPGMINYVFAASEVNISMWVGKGLVQAGAYNNLDWETEDHTPPVIKKDLRIFFRTESVPRMLELVRGNWDPKYKMRLQQVLLNAHLAPDAQSVLKSYQKTKRFELLNPQDQAVIQMALRKVRNYQKFWSSQ